MAYKIYLAKNKITGGEYVGVTKQALNDRRLKHYSDAGRANPGCRHFARAILKYGRDAFEWSVLIDGLSYEESIAAECDMIAARQPVYNILPGGRGFPKGFKKTAEQIENTASKLRGQKRTPEQIARMMAHRTPEFRAAVGATLRGRKRSPDTIAKMRANRSPDALLKPVLCLEDRVLFPSLKAAGEHYGVSITGKRHVRSAGGRHFVFSSTILSDDECERLLLDDREERRAHRKKAGPKGRPIICINTGEEFPNSVAAAAALGLSQSIVSLLCLQGGRTRAGVGFRFADAEEVIRPEKPAEIIEREEAERSTRFSQYRHLGPKATARRVVCLDDGQEFESASDAGKFYGTARSAIIEVCLRNPRRAQAGGRVFRYVGEVFDLATELETAKARTRTAGGGTKKLMKPVICLNDGIVYPSAIEASAAYGVHRTSIGEVCRGLHVHAKGLRFSYDVSSDVEK